MASTAEAAHTATCLQLPQRFSDHKTIVKPCPSPVEPLLVRLRKRRGQLLVVLAAAPRTELAASMAASVLAPVLHISMRQKFRASPPWCSPPM